MAVTQALPTNALDMGVVTSPKPSCKVRFYRSELDILRLFAFLMVWSAHALISFTGMLSARVLAVAEGVGSCGVPIFFFLSAYLITELLRREQLTSGRLHLRFFYARRTLRIWPLYFGVLGLYAVLGLRFHGFRIEPGRLLASCLLGGNWYIALHPAITTPLRSLWSISVEEQWYLLWPVLQRGLPARKLLAVCCLLVVCAQGTLIALVHNADPATLHVTAWVNSAVQFQYFALGAASALLLNGRIPCLRGSTRTLLAISGATALLLASSEYHIKQTSIPVSATSLVSGYVLAGAGVACLFFAVLGVSAAPWPRFLVRLGQLSFGLYVFHEAGFFLADTAARHVHIPATAAWFACSKGVALALTVALAFTSYYAWERPFLRAKRRWTIVQTREAQ